ncbi:MAG TPA: TetR/AcrR family transcriptional regulator, partial [Roseiflexaceae bacterium]|nr:TetR/AcrR family transcriptional regulator [Roseiflexaceae bacterium]
MPKPTFWNLPAEKRDALVAIALEEFAEHDYAAASVSRIVARAGIAKGSLYQYFDDKQELFLFLFDHAGKTLIDALDTATPADAGDDLFTLLRRRIRATTRAAIHFPLHARLIQRTYAMPPPFYAELAARGQAASRAYFRSLIERGMAHGTLASDIAPESAAFVLSTVFSAAGPYIAEILGISAAETATVA